RLDEGRDETLLEGVVHLREPDDGNVDAAGRCGGAGAFGCRAGNRMVDIEDVLAGGLAGGAAAQCRAGGDDEGTMGAVEGGGERFDGAAVLLADGREVGEVVVEGEVDDAVGLGGAGAQPIEVFECAAMNSGSGGYEFRG